MIEQVDLKKDLEIDGLIKRIEYSPSINLREISEFEFSKFDFDAESS